MNSKFIAIFSIVIASLLNVSAPAFAQEDQSDSDRIAQLRTQIAELEKNLEAKSVSNTGLNVLTLSSGGVSGLSFLYLDIIGGRKGISDVFHYAGAPYAWVNSFRAAAGLGLVTGILAVGGAYLNCLDREQTEKTLELLETLKA